MPLPPLGSLQLVIKLFYREQFGYRNGPFAAPAPPMDAHFCVWVCVCLSVIELLEMRGRIKMKFSGHEETISEGAYFGNQPDPTIC
jgi:hypothetical protein